MRAGPEFPQGIVLMAKHSDTFGNLLFKGLARDKNMFLTKRYVEEQSESEKGAKIMPTWEPKTTPNRHENDSDFCINFWIDFWEKSVQI